MAQYVAGDKIDLAIELRLTDELRAASWRQERMGDTYVMPLGEPIATNAEDMARHLFRDVRVTSSAAAAPSQDVDAILIPRLVGVERTRGVWAWSDSIVTAVLEWRMTKPSGELVWVQTVKGEGRGVQGNLFTHTDNARRQGQRLLEDLFQKSREAIVQSPEIRAL